VRIRRLGLDSEHFAEDRFECGPRNVYLYAVESAKIPPSIVDMHLEGWLDEADALR
jgi:hypothetical protein